MLQLLFEQDVISPECVQRILDNILHALNLEETGQEEGEEQTQDDKLFGTDRKGQEKRQ